MRETSPEEPRFEVLPLRAVPSRPLVAVEKSDPRFTASLSHRPLTAGVLEVRLIQREALARLDRGFHCTKS